MIDPNVTRSQRSLRAMRRICRSGMAVALLMLGLAVSSPASPASAAGEDVQSAFDVLIQALRQGTAGSVGRAALLFQHAIREDGGARPRLMQATASLLASLDGNRFDAGRSEAMLEGLAAGSVLAFGPWKPDLAPGTPVFTAVGVALHQRKEGDCVGISALKAFSTTPSGAAILRRSVRTELGGFVVDLPGAPDRLFHLDMANLDQYGIGDPAAAAIIGATFRYFRLDPTRDALPTNKVMELLAGHRGRHRRLADRDATPEQIIDFLLKQAAHVGLDTAMVFGGKPARNGDWSKGDGHAFAVVRIDGPARTLVYTNPWNEGREHSILIDDLAREAAGTSADFETVIFTPGSEN